ncbi:MAG: hypothetical protein ACSHYB_10810 [Roseibacillus sp.]
MTRGTADSGTNRPTLPILYFKVAAWKDHAPIPSVDATLLRRLLSAN